MSYTQNHIASQQINQVYSQGSNALFGVTGVSLVSVLLFWEPERAAMLVLWFATLLLLSLVRYGLLQAYRNDTTKEQHNRKWIKAYLLLELAMGFTWASLLIWISPASDIELILMMLILGSMSTGAMPMLASVLPIYIAFLFSGGLTTTLLMLLNDRAYTNYLAAFTLIYTMLLWLSALKHSQSYLHTLQLTQDKLDLVESLQLTNKQLLRQVYDTQSAEQEAREAETRFRTLANATNEGIVLYENGRIVDVNDKISSMLGYSREQLLEKNIEQLFVQSDHGLILELFGHNDGIPYEAKCETMDGRSFPVELIKRRFPIEGRKIYVFTLRDISELKHMAEIKDQFISTVSHELRTPITSIHASLGLLLGGVAGEVPKEFETLLNIAQQNSDRLNLLINDLLDMQKLDVGMLHFSFETTSLAELIEQSITLNLSFVEKYHTQMVFTGCDPQILVHVDRNRFIQVMTNLISNAAKFSPDNCTISITTTLQGQLVQVHIHNPGPAIPDHFKEKLFQRFTQADASNTRLYGGSGLGLYISKQILHQMKADINFVSDPQTGTTFTITLPVVTG